MAKERVSRTICDRCSGVFEERDTGVEEDVPASPVPKLYIEEGGRSVVKYEDLCDKCDDRVNNLIKDIMPLSKEKKSAKPKAKKPKKKAAAKEDSKKEASAPAGEKPEG